MTDKPAMVIVQFNFSNFHNMPQYLRQSRKVEGDQRGSSTPNGTMILPPTENCRIDSLVDDLSVGYRLVSAHMEKRANRNAASTRDHYWTARFTWVPKDDAVVGPEFAKVAASVEFDLFELCRRAFWRVRAYRNPRIIEGQEVGSFLSFNFEARKETVNCDNQPVLVWRRDENGRKLGDKPVPMVPAAVLRFEDDLAQLVFNSQASSAA